MKIEMLYPDVANLHGDNHNIVYLGQCRPDAQFIRTGLTETPTFVTSKVDLIYLGPMTEKGQLRVIERLRAHKERILELIEAGTVFLFTHNAMEVLGESIRNPLQGYEATGLGILPLTSHIDLMRRYNGKVLGQAEGVEIAGYKSQFSMVEAPETLPGFLVAERGIGRNKETQIEGVRRKNFIGTSLIGPLLIMNPPFTKALLRILDPDTEPALAFEDLAMSAYAARLADFHNPAAWKHWDPWERK